MRKIFLLSFVYCFLICFASFGQNAVDRSVTLSARSAHGGAYLVFISSKADSIKITYKIKKGVSDELSKDTNYRSTGFALIRNSGKGKRDSLDFYAKKLDSISQRYTHYDIFQVDIRAGENKEYDRVLNGLFAASGEGLENNRIVLDGTTMVMTLVDKKSARDIYAHSPDSGSHPALYAFLSETMNLYRHKNGLPSEDRSVFFGY